MLPSYARGQNLSVNAGCSCYGFGKSFAIAAAGPLECKWGLRSARLPENGRASQMLIGTTAWKDPLLAIRGPFATWGSLNHVPHILICYMGQLKSCQHIPIYYMGQLKSYPHIPICYMGQLKSCPHIPICYMGQLKSCPAHPHLLHGTA